MQAWREPEAPHSALPVSESEKIRHILCYEECPGSLGLGLALGLVLELELLKSSYKEEVFSCFS